jgi:N-carbamoyl-L-amino-acid hydrolase
VPTIPGGKRRTRRGIAAAAWARVQSAPADDLPGWFGDQAGLRGLEAWPDAAGNLWALNGDPEEDSPDAHPGLVLAAPLAADPSGAGGPSRGLVLGLAVVDVLNQLGFEPESPVSLLARVGSTLPADVEGRARPLVELVMVAGAEPVVRVARTGTGSGSATLARRLRVSGEPAAGHDPLLTFSMTVLAVAKQARLAGAFARTSDVRVEAADQLGRPTRLAADVVIVAGADDAAQTALAGLERQAYDRAGRDGTELVVLPIEPASDDGGGTGVRVEVGVDAEAAAQVEALTRLVEELAG